VAGLLLLKLSKGDRMALPFDGALSFLVTITVAALFFYLFRLSLKRLSAGWRRESFFPYDDAAMWVINVVWSIPTILLAMALSFSLGTWIESFWVIYIAVG